jgi:hypothetical protein
MTLGGALGRRALKGIVISMPSMVALSAARVRHHTPVPNSSRASAFPACSYLGGAQRLSVCSAPTDPTADVPAGQRPVPGSCFPGGPSFVQMRLRTGRDNRRFLQRFGELPIGWWLSGWGGGSGRYD